MTVFGIFITLVILQLHNNSTHPLTRGFDADGHIEYIRYIQKYHRVPLPSQGWELYQPPLYYSIVSFIPDIRWVKSVGVVSWIGIVFLSYILYKELFKTSETALVGAAFVAATPVVIYLTPSITNELFAGLLISLDLVLYLRFKKKGWTWQNSTILGFVLGLSLLAKATSLVVVIAIGIDLFLQPKKDILKLGFIFLLMSVIGGWFYARNILLYHNPFIASYDFAQHPLNQIRTARNLLFFFDLSAFLKFDLFNAQHYSFIAGTFFSWFYDGHNVIIPVQSFSRIGVILILFSLPLAFISILGFIHALKKLSEKNRVLVIYPVILIFSYILYNLKLPFYSTVKGTFLVSAILPYGYFLLNGLTFFKKYQYFILLYLLLYIMLIVKNFWILPHWYL